MPESERKKMKTSSENPWEDDFRLPDTVHPEHYDLYLHPNLSSKTFSGSVSITVKSSEARDYFLIHTKWLAITGTKILKIEGEHTEVIWFCCQTALKSLFFFSFFCYAFHCLIL